ncbi:exopolyphosphatase/guanosine-5'-triphosphate,3'-diphosphate pyrophosphatase [Salsuginibacillus halophilus]|uniref:Exopolyphosphatase/guanosine-5'-triphosphate, 3'-diphosphate pyrophosphatase n=1 Tax=Salsuginibacillus halophilus TaxID=517424 RepID=A0A2P8HAL4_9BACI|nr:Ppx/GppA phosphatase family protein [Salsuginibacillus halophilus]PSL43266.1 exopolyphosphatase/guanosine-5'-triphosphate,3'-diphosphate pyrophosphatase [Salsuginibacillus halophilus]
MNRHSDAKIAVIDMGSNSIRLVIHQVDEKRGYREIHNVKEVARLSQCFNEAGELNREGFSRIERTMKRFSEIILDHNVETVRGIATAAVRQAANQAEVLQFIYDTSGISFEVLSGDEEAFYGATAVVNATYIEDGITVDIGGGSTEVARFSNRDIVETYSFPFGALTLETEFLNGSEPNDERLKQLRSYLTEELQHLPWLKDIKLPLVGIGGSARNTALVHQRRSDYPLSTLHQYEMDARDMKQTVKHLASMPYERRLEVDGLSKDRADIIVPAAIILETLMQVIYTDRFMLSNKGLRDGLLFHTMFSSLGLKRFDDVANESLYQLKREYNIPGELAESVACTTQALFAGLKPYIHRRYLHEEAEELLRKGARTVFLGEYIDEQSSSDHTFYLLMHRSIDGISHQDRAALALISSFKSRKLFKKRSKQLKELFSAQALKQFEVLGAIMKLGYDLHITRRKMIRDVDVQQEKQKLIIHLVYEPGRDPFFEMKACEKHKKHLEKALGASCVFTFREAKTTEYERVEAYDTNH